MNRFNNLRKKLFVKLLWKNVLKSLFKQRVAFISLLIAITLFTFIMILTPFITGFLTKQEDKINQEGNASQMQINFQSNNILTNNLGYMNSSFFTSGVDHHFADSRIQLPTIKGQSISLPTDLSSYENLTITCIGPNQYQYSSSNNRYATQESITNAKTYTPLLMNILNTDLAKYTNNQYRVEFTPYYNSLYYNIKNNHTFLEMPYDQYFDTSLNTGLTGQSAPYLQSEKDPNSGGLTKIMAGVKRYLVDSAMTYNLLPSCDLKIGITNLSTTLGNSIYYPNPTSDFPLWNVSNVVSSNKNSYTWNNCYKGQDNDAIDRPFLLEGQWPRDPDSVAISSSYAANNNLKVGSIENINSDPMKISGIFTCPQFVYPQLSLENLIPNTKNDGIIVTPFDYRAGYSSDNDYVKTARFFESSNFGSVFSINMKIINNNTNQDASKSVVKNVYNYFSSDLTSILNDKTSFLGNLMPDIGRNGGVQLIDNSNIGGSNDVFSSRRTFIDYIRNILILVSGVMEIMIIASCGFIIFVVIRKQIDDDSKELGILKSLGYTTFELSNLYLAFPTLSAIIAPIVAFIAAIFLSLIAIKLFMNYLNFTILNAFSGSTISFLLNGNTFVWIILTFVIPLILVVLFSLLISTSLLNKNMKSLLVR